MVIGAVLAVSLSKPEDGAPLPTDDELRTQGFAVWPEDTVEEGMKACQDAE